MLDVEVGLKCFLVLDGMFGLNGMYVKEKGWDVGGLDGGWGGRLGEDGRCLKLVLRERVGLEDWGFLREEFAEEEGMGGLDGRGLLLEL